MFLPNILLVVPTHNHNLCLWNLSSRIGCQRNKFITTSLNQRIYNCPLTLFFIIHFHYVRNRIIISYSPNLVYISPIKTTTSKRTALVIHWLDFFHFVVNYIISLTSISNDLIVDNACIINMMLPPSMYIYLLLKQIECDDRPYFRLLQYVNVFFVNSYLYIFWLFILLLRLPPIK